MAETGRVLAPKRECFAHPAGRFTEASDSCEIWRSKRLTETMKQAHKWMPDEGPPRLNEESLWSKLLLHLLQPLGNAGESLVPTDFPKGVPLARQRHPYPLLGMHQFRHCVAMEAEEALSL